MSSICSTGPHGRATQFQPANALVCVYMRHCKTLGHCRSSADGEMFYVRKAQLNAAEGCASRAERPGSCSAKAKFRCPRNTSMNKQFADMWRPQLGAGGVTMDGIGSFIFLTDLDLGKMQMSN